jgi:murein DD-endopeptidase MepM/ murein hydrolase activator NlpD
MPSPVKGGKLIGFPFQGSHKPGATTPANWQSDNAVDIAVPSGTPVYATHDGTIGPNIGFFRSSSPYLQGQRLTVLWGGNAAYYAHLSRIVVHPGQQVKAGQLLGYSGVANGVAHLHYAVEAGSPLDWVRNLPSKVSNLVAGEDPGTNKTISTAGCAGTTVLFVISIFGGFELVKIFF